MLQIFSNLWVDLGRNFQMPTPVRSTPRPSGTAAAVAAAAKKRMTAATPPEAARAAAEAPVGKDLRCAWFIGNSSN